MIQGPLKLEIILGPPPHGKKNLVSPVEYEQSLKQQANLAEQGQEMGGGTWDGGCLNNDIQSQAYAECLKTWFLQMKYR